jgi:hypothetical protein
MRFGMFGGQMATPALPIAQCFENVYFYTSQDREFSNKHNPQTSNGFLAHVQKAK